ncbi:holo-ACP synthase [Bacillus massilinigeriensis]|uniref:holo-ACP synthase n=1 Tax=Bacillus massilionigeriensis TaxID=1805475 RepID=UPI00096B0981|nr:holo-ACP synthase [Bacillus massilionigeriensis]
MITGIGIDIVEIERIQLLLDRQNKFIDRILTDKEKKEFELFSGRRRLEFFAGRFAAKEAFSKAFGTGIGESLSFLDIEITKEANGRVFITKPFNEGVHLSISHSEQYAIAQVVIEKI